MGRKGKLELSMLTGILRFLKERPDSQGKMVICERYLEKLYKSRDSVKKKEYKAQLHNILEFLVRDSTDKLELKAKLEREREEVERQNSKRVQLHDHVISLERELSSLREVEARLQDERELKYKAEEALGEQLTENEKLTTLVSQLQKKNAKLQKKLEKSEENKG